MATNVWEILVGIICLGVMIWEFYSVVKSFRGIRQHGNSGTTGFAMLSIWSGVIFGLIMFAIAFDLLFPKLAGF